MAKSESNGKYLPVEREFHPITAGNRTEGLGGGQSTKREFKGSGIRSYTFTRIVNGVEVTRTFRAHSVKDANRLAASAGFKTTDREVKRRRKRKK